MSRFNRIHKKLQETANFHWSACPFYKLEDRRKSIHEWETEANSFHIFE